LCVLGEREFEVAIKFFAHFSIHQLHKLLSGKKVETPQEAINAIDIVLKELASHR
jgi:eukaryotic translation initiation factor 2C